MHSICIVLPRLSGCRFLGLGKGKWHFLLPISADRTWFNNSVLCSLCRTAIRNSKQTTCTVPLPDFGSSCEPNIRQVAVERLAASEACWLVGAVSCVRTFLVWNQQVGLASSARTTPHIAKETPWENLCDMRDGCGPRHRRNLSNDGLAVISLGA